MKQISVSCVVLFLFAFAAVAIADEVPAVNDGNAHGDPPYLLENGWKPLLNGKDLSGWTLRNPERGGWGATKGVYWSGANDPKKLIGIPDSGDRAINTMTNFKPAPSDLVTEEKFGDVELYVEFMIPANSNSGVYLHGLYEVQIWDSYQKDLGTHITDQCGAIYNYEPQPGTRPQGGVAPLNRAERAPGQWQSYQIWFQAPRFDESGKKTANAKFLRVLHNGVLIHENVDREGPTQAAMKHAEAPTNPLMLQGDHGPVAFRNIYIRPLRPLPPPPSRIRPGQPPQSGQQSQ